MTPGAPHYPPILQTVLDHAARFAELLAQRERACAPGEAGALWLAGRATEVQCVAAAAAVDWHEARRSAGSAAERLARYLHDLHEALAIHLGVGAPSCCRPPDDTLRGLGGATPGNASSPTECVAARNLGADRSMDLDEEVRS
jgi:hypothetical protein